MVKILRLSFFHLHPLLFKVSIRDLNSGTKTQSNVMSGGLNMSNTNQQKQEVVFGKSSTNQKAPPTSPQGTPLQTTASNGGATIQRGQVYICLFVFKKKGNPS